MDQQQLTTSQFGSNARNYLSSNVHASGADLARLRELAGVLRPAHALDLGCGAGHASYALASAGVAQVIACDPSPGMLAVVAEEAARRGMAGITVREAAAEALPFTDHSFDFIATRFSAHHWRSVPAALAECARVLAPGGRMVVIDMVAPEAALLDTSLQAIELLRDASHVRDYRVSEWRWMLQQAGFAEQSFHEWKLPLEFQPWIRRIATPAARVAALHALFDAFPREVGEYFQVSPQRDFTADCAWFEVQAR
jgi:ubiquinone/menaquinone biosynthesis C-methylase UbiE